MSSDTNLASTWAIKSAMLSTPRSASETATRYENSNQWELKIVRNGRTWDGAPYASRIHRTEDGVRWCTMCTYKSFPKNKRDSCGKCEENCAGHVTASDESRGGLKYGMQIRANVTGNEKATKTEFTQWTYCAGRACGFTGIGVAREFVGTHQRQRCSGVTSLHLHLSSDVKHDKWDNIKHTNGMLSTKRSQQNCPSIWLRLNMHILD